MGRRRGGVFLKTGVVAKKQKQDTEVSLRDGFHYSDQKIFCSRSILPQEILKKAFLYLEKQMLQ